MPISKRERQRQRTEAAFVNAYNNAKRIEEARRVEATFGQALGVEAKRPPRPRAIWKIPDAQVAANLDVLLRMGVRPDEAHTIAAMYFHADLRPMVEWAAVQPNRDDVESWVGLFKWAFKEKPWTKEKTNGQGRASRARTAAG